jgi:hypothetical protein
VLYCFHHLGLGIRINMFFSKFLKQILEKSQDFVKLKKPAYTVVKVIWIIFNFPAFVNIENLFPEKYDFKCKKSSFVSQSRIVNSFAIYLFLTKLSMSDLILKPRKNVLREVYYWGLSNVKDRGLFETIRRRRDVQQLLRTLIMGQLFSWKQFKNLRTPVTKICQFWIPPK